MKKVLKIVGIVLLVLIVIGMFGNKKTEEPTKAVETAVEATAEVKTEAPTEEAEQIEEAIEDATEEAEEEYQLSVDDIITIYKISLEQNFTDDGQGYDVIRQDDTILINLWSEGITGEALQAKTNDKYKSDWNYMVDNIKDSSESFQSVLDENGYSDMTSAISVVNDVNHDRVLLLVVNGVVLYDAVNEIDLIS